MFRAWLSRKILKDKKQLNSFHWKCINWINTDLAAVAGYESNTFPMWLNSLLTLTHNALLIGSTLNLAAAADNKLFTAMTKMSIVSIHLLRKVKWKTLRWLNELFHSRVTKLFHSSKIVRTKILQCEKTSICLIHLWIFERVFN